jgi:hypothetical protein
VKTRKKRKRKPLTQAERTARHRAKRVAEGLCSSCQKRPAGGPDADAKDMCTECYEKHKAYQNEKYVVLRTARRCTHCRAPATGYLCDFHAERRRERRRAANQAKRAAT